MYHWGRFTREDRNNDLCDLVYLFWEAIGGQKRYSSHPQEVKDICCGLKKSLILKKFKTVSDLKFHLETQSWS